MKKELVELEAAIKASQATSVANQQKAAEKEEESKYPIIFLGLRLYATTTRLPTNAPGA